MNSPQNLSNDLARNYRLHFDSDRLSGACREMSGHLRQPTLFGSIDRVQRQPDGGPGPNFDEAKPS